MRPPPGFVRPSGSLECRDVTLGARVVYVHRSFTKGRLKCPKTEASRRAVPSQTIALEALEHQPSSQQSALVFPAERGGYLDLHDFRNREWKPVQVSAGIEPLRRIYDLRHTFATFALRAGISTFDLSRYMGASLTMIDRHYGHLAGDGREHEIRLLDELSAGERPRWTLRGHQSLRPPPAETTKTPFVYWLGAVGAILYPFFVPIEKVRRGKTLRFRGSPFCVGRRSRRRVIRVRRPERIGSWSSASTAA